MYCKIGNEAVVAEWISPSLVSCATPDTLDVGNYSVGLSANAVDFVAAPVQLQVRPALQVMRATEAFLMGPMRGGSIVTMTGTGFDSSHQRLECSFGGEIAEAAVLNTTHLMCISPPSERDGPVPLTLQIDWNA